MPGEVLRQRQVCVNTACLESVWGSVVVRMKKYSVEDKQIAWTVMCVCTYVCEQVKTRVED